MRWYSVKKYTPPWAVDVIVRVFHIDGWDEVTQAYFRDGTWDFRKESFSKDEYIVTHFAIITPVEIEE